MRKLLIIFVCFLSIGAINLPDEGDQIAIFGEFKGLNTKLSSQNLTPDFATRAENLRFSTIGSLEKRLSFSKYNGTTLGTSPVTWGIRFYYTDDSNVAQKKLVIAYDTTLKVGTDSTGTFTNIKTGLTADQKYTSIVYKDHLYACNGTDNCQRWSGSGNTKDMGVAVPSSTTAGIESSPGAGNIANGSYKYKITFLYDGYQESNGQDTQLSVTVGSGPSKISLSSIPTGATDQGVTARKIYRTQAGGSTFYYVATISDNTTTTYTDNTADGSLDTTLTIPTDHDTPPAFKYITLHKERIFGVKANSSDLYFSTIEDGVSLPDVFATDNFIPISPDDGDIIQGISEDNSGILTIFKRNSIRKLFVGTAPPNEWEVSDIFDIHGLVAPYSLTKTPNGLMYLSRSDISKRNIRVFNGQTSQNISERVEPTFLDISNSLVENVIANYHGNIYRMAYADRSTGSIKNNRILLFDIDRDSYEIDKKDRAWFISWNGAGDFGQLYGADSMQGFVYREDSSSTDLYIKLLSQISTGTFSQTTTLSTTEQSPEITISKTTADGSADDTTTAVDDIGTKTWVSQRNAWTTYNGELKTWWPSGQWVSDVYEINAINLINLYWTETALWNQEIQFWIRTGDSIEATESASWQGPYSNASGSDISAVTALQFIQLKAQLYTQDISDNTPSPKLYRSSSASPDDYVIWVNAGLGSSVESSIPFVWQTGEYDFGASQYRKRFRHLRATHESDSTGNYTIYYSIDGGTESSFTVDMSTDATQSVKYFPITAIGRRMKMRVEENSADAFEFKELQVIFSYQTLDN